jgi:dipeptidyl aminopeptidase/acylaminoacyl peptidase
MIPYFGASVYDDPAVYAKSSPITFIKNVRTPTLVMVGERDGSARRRSRMSSGTR